MKFNPAALIVSLAFGLFLLIALQTRTIGPLNRFFVSVDLVALAVISIAAVASMIRHRRFEPHDQFAALRELKRWLGLR